VPGGQSASIMLGNRKLVADTRCGIYDLIKPHVDVLIWDFKKHLQDHPNLIADAVYVLGPDLMRTNADLVRELAQSNTPQIVYSNPSEGSETMLNHCRAYRITDLVEQGQIWIVTGGYVPDSYINLYHENFLPKLLDYEENITAIDQYQQNYSLTRPYKFLCLNGRYRPHRAQLLNKLGTLKDHAVWTNLDSQSGTIKLLDPKYEHAHVATPTNLSTTGFVKNQLFNNKWGEIYLKAELYQDTYFSLVTETVFDYPYSFRTEKIWKPIAIGHPFIAVANQGFYRDLHNLGFQTFGSVIDESFDQIENSADRLDRIVQIVQDLCQQDLASFLDSCYNTCKYNQQLLAELGPKIRAEFPQKFLNFINK
jgi:hypothetical protein